MQNKNNKYWFKAKTYGYGWYPSTWQGWLILSAYLITIAASVSLLEIYIDKYPVFYFIFVSIITGLLIYICYKKGEPAKWRWGKK